MFPSSSFNHKDISMTYPCKTIEISKVTLTKIWISIMIKLKAWRWPVWPKHVAWYSYQTNKGVLTEWFYINITERGFIIKSEGNVLIVHPLDDFGTFI